MNLQEMTKEEAIRSLRIIANKREKKQQLNKTETYLLQQVEYFVEREIIRRIRKRQEGISNLKTYGEGYIAIWGNELTPGCHNCLFESGLGAIRSVSRCNLNCKFCYYFGLDEEPNLLQNHFKLGNNIYTNDDIKIILEKQGNNIKGLSWVYYEPFMDFNKHIDIIKHISKMGIHQHMYTNGTLCKEEHFKILQDCGLSELRFDLAATNCSEKVLKNIKIARKYFKYLCIESPMTQEYFNNFKAKKSMILDTGIDHINCAELHIKNSHIHFINMPLYRYKYGYVSPIDSRHLTYDLIELAEKEKWREITINDCSNETKFYRSFLLGDSFGKNSWRNEMKMPIDWYENVLLHYKLFDNICKKSVHSVNKENHKDTNICKIKEVLNNLNIKTSILNLSSETFSSNILILNGNILNLKIGTNKQSIFNSQFALYNEFIALLQTNLLFNHTRFASRDYCKSLPNNTYKQKLLNNNLILDFIYSPKEQIISIEDFLFWLKTIFNKLFFKDLSHKTMNNYAKILKADNLIGIPYTNLTNSEVKYMPASLIKHFCGTNGICYGRTREESINMGIYDILKKYIIREIYLKSIELPTIPTDYFSEYNIDEKLYAISNRDSLTLIFKDCSLGIKLPAIGLLIINQSRKEYSFIIESNLSCSKLLTKLIDKIFHNEIKFMPCDSSLGKNNLASNNIINDKKYNYLKTIKNNDGLFPNSIFENNNLFSKVNFIDSPDSFTELKYLTDLIQKAQFNLYIRDVSYFGIPSFHIYIPGMSEVNYIFDKDELYYAYLFDNNLETLFNLNNAKNNRIKKINNSLSYLYAYFKNNEMINSFIYNTNKNLSLLNIDALLIMLSFKIGDYKKAYYYINNFISDNPNVSQYFYCVRDYLYFRNGRNEDISIDKILELKYEKKVVTEVFQDFKDTNKIFKNYTLPSCFECDECLIRNDCKYFEVLKIAKKVSEEIKSNAILYEKLGVNI